MSKRPLGDLLKSMQGKSCTVGWDAVVMYDQRKTNELLYQLYVERYSTGEGIIEPASMEMVWGDGSYIEHLFDLKLGAPKLSFEKSSLEQPPRTRLTLDMIGGMIVSTNTLPGGGEICLANQAGFTSGRAANMDGSTADQRGGKCGWRSID